MPAPLASWRAMLVDQSPWSRLRGRSTLTSAGTVTVEVTGVDGGLEGGTDRGRELFGGHPGNSMGGPCGDLPAAASRETASTSSSGSNGLEMKPSNPAPLASGALCATTDAGDQQHRHRVEAVVRADRGDGPPAVVGGHLGVEHDDVGAWALGVDQPGHRLVPVGGLLDGEPGELEVDLQQAPDRLGVVADEDQRCGTAGAGPGLHGRQPRLLPSRGAGNHSVDSGAGRPRPP